MRRTAASSAISICCTSLGSTPTAEANLIVVMHTHLHHRQHCRGFIRSATAFCGGRARFRCVCFPNHFLLIPQLCHSRGESLSPPIPYKGEHLSSHTIIRITPLEVNGRNHRFLYFARNNIPSMNEEIVKIVSISSGNTAIYAFFRTIKQLVLILVRFSLASCESP